MYKILIDLDEALTTFIYGFISIYYSTKQWVWVFVKKEPYQTYYIEDQLANSDDKVHYHRYAFFRDLGKMFEY